MITLWMGGCEKGGGEGGSRERAMGGAGKGNGGGRSREGGGGGGDGREGGLFSARGC